MSKIEKIDVTQYLARIGCSLELKPTLKYLKTLHRSHMIQVPFENLDNFLGNQILLDIQKIYQKVVVNKRGGFCYELNGLFYHLLKHLGFSAHLISARDYDHVNNTFRSEFDHMAILVNIENRNYLTDVGYGISFKEPKLVDTSEVQMDYNSYYRISKNIDDEYTLQSSLNSHDFRKEYLFTTKERQMVEFIDMCHFHHKNKKSHLTKTIFVTQARKDGQITITDKLFTSTRLGKTEEYKIHNLDEFKVKLYEHFNIQYKRNKKE